MSIKTIEKIPLKVNGDFFSETEEVDFKLLIHFYVIVRRCWPQSMEPNAHFVTTNPSQSSSPSDPMTRKAIQTRYTQKNYEFESC